MKVLFYIEPLTEREAPTWKRAWLDYAAKMARAIAVKRPSLVMAAVVGDGLAAEARNIFKGARVEVLKHSELVPRFGATALQVALGWYAGGTDESQRAMGDLVKQRTRGFLPDACISFSPAPFLRQAFPNAPVLHFELGMVSRAPFPMTGYLDPIGMFKQGFIGRHEDAVTRFVPTAAERKLVAQLRESSLRQISRANPLSAVADGLARGYRKRILLALQFSNFYAYDAHATYPEQYDLLIQTLESTPTDVGVFVAEHPQHPLLSGETLAHLQSEFPNLLWSPDFRETTAASQYLMEHSDAVVTVSSSVGWQALLWRKPLLVAGRSHLDLVAASNDLRELAALLEEPKGEDERNERVLTWHLARYASPFDVLFGRSEIVERLDRAIASHRAQDWATYYEKPFSGANVLIASYAEAADQSGTAYAVAEAGRHLRELQELLADVEAALEVSRQEQRNLSQALEMRTGAYDDRVRELAAEASRSEALQLQVSALAAEVAAGSQAIADAQRQLNAAHAQAAAHAAAVAHLEEERARRVGQEREREAVLAELQGRLAVLKQTLEARDLELSALRSRSATVAELEGKLAALTQVAESQASELQSRREQAAAVAKDVAELKERLGVTSRRLEVQSGLLEAARASEVLVSELQGKLAALTQRSETLAIELQARARQAEALAGAESRLNATSMALESTRQELATERQATTSLKSELAEREAALAQTCRLLEEERGGRQAAQDKLHQIDAERAQQAETIAALQVRALSLQHQLGEMEVLIGNHRKVIEQIWSSRSWRFTKGLRFAGRLMRGDWADSLAALRRYMSLVGSTPTLPPPPPSSGMSSAMAPASALPTVAVSPAGPSAPDHDVSTTAVAHAVDRPYLPWVQASRVNRRILLVSYYCPSRSHAGGLRILDLYALLRRKAPGVELHLYTHQRPSIDWSEDEVSAIFDRVYWSPTEEVTAAGLTAIAGRPLHFDVIDLQFHQAAYDIDSYRGMGRTILFTPMESLARFTFLQARSAFQATGRFPLRELARGFRAVAEEVVFSFKVDKVVCVSRSDAAFLRAITYLRRIQSLETGVSEIEFPGAGAGGKMRDLKSAGQTLLYVAYFGSQTNVDALKWYLEEVHPRVLARVPSYRFIVVGRGDLSSFARYVGPAVELVGEVPRIAPFIESARVGIAPALSGSGFRGKVNQYALFGVPTVVSPISAKGLAYQTGKDILIGRNAAEFAEHCIALLVDDALNAAIGSRAHATCAAKYTWDSKWPAVERLYGLNATE
ncbi:MAG: glycosyltransferase [Betaproteobacteria bacterium]